MSKHPTTAPNFIPLGASLGLCGLLFFLSQLQIKHINCLLPTGLCPPEITASLAALHNKSLFFSNIDTETHNLAAQYHLELDTLTKKIPNTLTLHFVPNPSVYALESNGQKWFVTTKGELVPLSTNTAVPIIKVEPQVYDLTTSVPTQVHTAATKLITSLHHYQLQPKHITIKEHGFFVLETETNVQLLIPFSNPALALKKTQYIMQNANLSSVDVGIKQLDLRYKLPVARTTTY